MGQFDYKSIFVWEERKLQGGTSCISREIAEAEHKKIYMKEHHLLEEDFEVQYCCALCSDTGYTVDAQGRYVPCSCLKELTVRDIAEKSNMGGRIKKKRLKILK